MTFSIECRHQRPAHPSVPAPRTEACPPARGGCAAPGPKSGLLRPAPAALAVALLGAGGVFELENSQHLLNPISKGKPRVPGGQESRKPYKPGHSIALRIRSFLLEENCCQCQFILLGTILPCNKHFCRSPRDNLSAAGRRCHCIWVRVSREPLVAISFRCAGTCTWREFARFPAG